VTGNIEGLYALKHKTLLSLSEQELVDCDHVDHGCYGGMPMNGYHAVAKLGGLESEKDYKYKGSVGKCRLDKSKVCYDLYTKRYGLFHDAIFPLPRTQLSIGQG
jgi:cathepsin F